MPGRGGGEWVENRGNIKGHQGIWGAVLDMFVILIVVMDACIRLYTLNVLYCIPIIPQQKCYESAKNIICNYVTTFKDF